MASWRDTILREFAPKVSKLTLVADPDGILLEEGILQGIRDRGFELIPFDDHVAFRYAYESKFRSRWDRGEETDLVVVLRSSESDLCHLPYDLLRAGRKLSFNLGDIFPNLSYPVVAALDRGDLDRLYDAQKRHRPGKLGDNATKEFALRHVFEVAPELINQPSDLLRALLRRHYRKQRIPHSLDERFIEVLRQNDLFRDWPLEQIVPDREVFFAFLQERWPFFLDQTAGGSPEKARETSEGYGLNYPGPVDLPFDHHDIRVYVDNLFVEGLLEPVAHGRAESLVKTWVGVGIATDAKADNTKRAESLLKHAEDAIPPEDARYDDWLRYARGWAELLALSYEDSSGPNESLDQKIHVIQAAIDSAFEAWLLKRFSGLINLPPSPPVMLHHLPRYVARHVVDSQERKAAIIVVDGLSLDQWVAMRGTVSSLKRRLLIREDALFAWIPTITSVSRQAMFSGRAPIYFPDTIHTTDRESALWSQFWVDQGLSPNQIAYIKRLGDGPLDGVSEIVSHPKTRVIGLVVDKVDKIMHGMELGSAGMHNQVRQWSEQPFLGDLVDLLVDAGFRVYLTSDHGNIEASGCGRPAEGAVADLRGERVRVYTDQVLRSQVKERFPDSAEWTPVGLPVGYLPLLAPQRLAFVGTSEKTVAHGGIAMEEVIVPLVQIDRRDE